MSDNNYRDIQQFALNVRKDVAKILHRTRDSHIGGGYSSIDILSVLYTRVLDISPENLDDPNRNVFILSKGHIAASLYTVLAHKGIIPMEDLEKHVVDGENYAGHSRRYVVPGVEMSAGSLGHGANVGIGMAYAKRCMGCAARFSLSNLALIIDRNRLQSYGSDVEVMNMGDMAQKFRSFGCNVQEINGHDYGQILKALMTSTARMPSAPTVIVADTIKGKGASFMENRLEWHFKSPNDEQLETILKELES